MNRYRTEGKYVFHPPKYSDFWAPVIRWISDTFYLKRVKIRAVKVSLSSKLVRLHKQGHAILWSCFRRERYSIQTRNSHREGVLPFEDLNRVLKDIVSEILQAARQNMKIATFNANSIRSRLDIVIRWAFVDIGFTSPIEAKNLTTALPLHREQSLQNYRSGLKTRCLPTRQGSCTRHSAPYMS